MVRVQKCELYMFEFDHCFVHCMTQNMCDLSPNRTSESSMHNASKRTGLAVGCDLQYLELPMCTGHREDGTPQIEMKPWPFLLPSSMAWG